MLRDIQHSDNQLATWRDLRQRASQMSLEQVLAEFQHIKPQNRYIDYYDPHSWPSVFEIVQQGYWCHSGITLVLTATLCYSGFIKSDELRFDVISNYITGVEGLILTHDDVCYNFIAGQAIDLHSAQQQCTTYQTHTVSVQQLLK